MKFRSPDWRVFDNILDAADYHCAQNIASCCDCSLWALMCTDDNWIEENAAQVAELMDYEVICEEETHMNEISKVARHAEICTEINKLYETKNHDYGDSFHESYVEEGMAMARIRLGDKFSRFKTLTKSGEQRVKDESIRDTLIDLANYAIMTVLEMDDDNTTTG